ncbi:MAG TPA: hypothetical protein VHT73_11465 [Thermodesulfobacteriota bacterium]|nr:hypothetical protein [Thermodesulfobacteriota bacterium]
MNTYKNILTRYIPILIYSFILASMLFVISVSDSASAANIIVNGRSDAAVAGEGYCTLREAIKNANSDSDTTGGDCIAGSGADTITFSVSGTITLRSNLPGITSSDGLTIDGGNAITISGNNAVRIFFVSSGSVFTLQNITVAKGSAYGVGGGIWNDQGILTIKNSTFSNNSAEYEGGGIYSYQGIVTVKNSTFSNNGVGWGGGIYNDQGALEVTGSTFYGNQGGYESEGAGIYNNGTAIITNSIFSENSADIGGGGIMNLQGTVPLRNTILANNYGGNCSGTITDGGGNLSSNSSCKFSAPDSRNNINAGLGPVDLKNRGSKE